MDIIYRYDPYKPVTSRRLEDSTAAIELLERGHQRYATIVTQVQKELVGDHSTHQVIIPSDPLSVGFALAAGVPPVQSPFALMLGCSDARVPIEQIFDQSPNDLFVIRVAGNVLGVECLGSIDYAVNQFSAGLKLLVVLGHSTCGAVSAAVDSYLAPKDYASIAFTHPLRSLVDRIQVAVRGAATALKRVDGEGTADHPSYRAALWETAVYLNAAITAYDMRREVDRLASPGTRVVYGVFDLVEQRVRARPAAAPARTAEPVPIFADVPDGPAAFNSLSDELARAVARKRLQGAAPAPTSP
jgi:carbonic anhydrase